MNAIFNAHRLASNLCLARETPTASLDSLTDPTGTFGQSAVFGFPYLDTLKLLEHGSLSGGASFYAKGDNEELRQLGERLQAGRGTDDGSLEPLQAIFCEHPTNPLLNLPPLPDLVALARRHHLPLVVDDTVGFGYWSLLDDERQSPGHQPDIVVSSLSKVFSGAGNCMGGALVLNRTSPLYSELKPLLDAQ
jgi:cystathionine gamma-synthase